VRTLIDLFLQTVDAPPRNDLLTFRRKDGKSVSYSTADFVEGVLAIRRYLLELGLKEGDRVAIWAANCPEWHIADFGCLTAGMVVVPVYATSPTAQVEFVLSHSEARAVLFAGDAQGAVLNQIRDRLPAVLGWLALDQQSASWHVRLCDQMAANPPLGDLDALPSIRRFAESIRDSATAGIVYTSGTTGQPKGVMLTHANICFDLRQSMQRLQFRSVERALSVLPLAHVFERILCYGYFACGISIAYGDPHDLKELLRIHRPVTMGCVPRILEKILESVYAEIDVLPGRKRNIARWMLNSSVQRVMNKGAGGISALLGSTLAKPLLFRRVRRKLGDLQFLVCGGAYLDPAVEAFFSRRRLFSAARLRLDGNLSGDRSEQLRAGRTGNGWAAPGWRRGPHRRGRPDFDSRAACHEKLFQGPGRHRAKHARRMVSHWRPGLAGCHRPAARDRAGKRHRGPFHRQEGFVQSGRAGIEPLCAH
jgi:long-chain acyl-CoA synthetase